MQFRTLLDMGGGGGGGDGASGRDEVVRTLVDDCLQRMPPRFDIEKAQDKYKISYTESLNTGACIGAAGPLLRCFPDSFSPPLLPARPCFPSSPRAVPMPP